MFFNMDLNIVQHNTSSMESDLTKTCYPRKLSLKYNDMVLLFYMASLYLDTDDH